MLRNAASLYLSIIFMRRMMQSFDKWPAFKAGLIDKDGKILKKASTPAEKKAFGSFDRLILFTKILLMKYLPQTMLAGLYLRQLTVKESDEMNIDDQFRELITEKSGSFDAEMKKLLNKVKSKTRGMSKEEIEDFIFDKHSKDIEKIMSTTGADFDDAMKFFSKLK